MSTSNKKQIAPVTLTVLRSGFTVPFDDYSSRTALRGEVITLSPSAVEATADRHGNTWVTMTEDEQVSRWGHVNFRIGDHSEGIAFLGEDDERIRFERRERDIIAANAISDPQARAEAHREVKRVYGAAQSTQRTLRSYEA